MGRGGRAPIVVAVGVVAAAILVVIMMRGRVVDGVARPNVAPPEAGVAADDGVARVVDPAAVGGIEGTVVDASGALRPGAAVAARGDRAHQAAVADERGSFTFRGLPVGRYLVSASAADGAAGMATAEVASHGNTEVVLRLSAIQGAVTVSGHVHDILGGSVSGAEVWIGADKEDLTVIARTQAAGDFAARVSPGRQELRVRAAGYAEVADEIVVTDDLVVDLVIHPASTLGGTVVDASGHGVPVARVRAQTNRGASSFEAVSNAEGHFDLRDLPAGRYDINATTATGAGGLKGVNLAPADSRDLRIKLSEAALVTGRVQGTSGQLLAGATVELSGVAAFDEKVTTGPDGRYRMTGIIPGAVKVKACAPAHECAWAKERFAAVGVTNFDVTLPAGATLRLRVVDKDGKPVHDAHGYLADFSSCATDANGECVIDNAPPRKTKLTVDHVTAGHAAEELTVAKGETLHEVHLVPGATVRGTVRWDDGKPAAGVQVFDRELLARTRGDGRYELPNVAPGHVWLRAAEAMDLGDHKLEQRYGIDDANRSAMFEVHAGETHDNADIVLARRSKKISGVVVGADRVPVPYARVGAAREGAWEGEHAGTGPLGGAAATYSGAEGTFTIESVADGKYVVWADADEQPVGRTRDVAAGSEHVTVELPAAASIEGDVRDEGGGAIATFVVHAGSRFDEHTEPFSSGDGHFVLRGLPPGHYALNVEAYGMDGAGRPVSMIGSVPDFDLAAGEHKEVAVVARAGLTVSGRVVAWPDMTPRGGIELSARGPPYIQAAPTTEDGLFQLQGVGPGAIELWSFDVDGKREQWTRQVAPGQPVVDIGDLAFTPGKSGAGPFQFSVDGQRALVVKILFPMLSPLGLQKDDEIASVDGHPVATLGPNSLCGLLQGLTPETPVVVKKSGSAELTTIFMPASPRTVPSRL